MAQGPSSPWRPQVRRIVWHAVILLLAGFILVGLAPGLAFAQSGVSPSSIVIEARSGKVLTSDHAETRRFPASLTKMMTLYLTFDALRHHRISLHSTVPVSAHAASMEPTKLWLKPGSRITVKQCILGMITLSANDAAAAIAERLGHSESRFARQMTRRAHRLGMRHTVFRNASGLPDAAQVTTAHDMARLARALIRDFPQYYRYFSVRSFVFHGQTIYGHNPMLELYAGADGLKTGYTSAAGYNLATSARRGGVRIIGIVLGSPNIPQRSAEMVSLLDSGFARYHPAVQIAHARSHLYLPRLIATAHAAERPADPPPVHHSTAQGYSVQVGTFPSRRTALHAVRSAVAKVGGAPHVERFTVHKRTVWRGRVAMLTRPGALRTCSAHRRNAGLCFIMKPDGHRWHP